MGVVFFFLFAPGEELYHVQNTGESKPGSGKQTNGKKVTPWKVLPFSEDIPPG